MHVRIFLSRYRGYTKCSSCQGERLCQEARDVLVGDLRLGQVTRLPVSEAKAFFDHLPLSETQLQVAGKVLDEIRTRIDFLVRVGLDYLSLERLTSSLSGGEMQRIHLAASLGSTLSGTLYVLDEPSIGLHPRDQGRLIEILKRLRDLGNTIVVVEHEKQIMLAADKLVDIGPGAGEHGGEVVFSGTPDELLQSERSLTAKYLRDEIRIPTPVFRRSRSGRYLRILGAKQHNLKNVDIEIPLGLLVCVTGVSGSGKSTLVNEILYQNLKKLRGDWNGPVGQVDHIEGWEHLSEVLLVDQSPIGRTPRSNPVTYTKAFDEIRSIFASTREATARGLAPRHFSFNLQGGRCESCQGSGVITVEMQFLADVQLTCEECRGKRYQKNILDVLYRGQSIDDVLNMTVGQAIEFFSEFASLKRKLRVLQRVGLGYLRLGQPATTLSGGEAQRIKLASYLARRTSGAPLFILDEPTTGLHFDDISKLLRAFDTLIDGGASILVIEHNLDVIKAADWIIDLGPEGGERGGQVVVTGQPNQVANHQLSHTGQHLRTVLNQQARPESLETC
jgi:excinuclease ABC subunit A